MDEYKWKKIEYVKENSKKYLTDLVECNLEVGTFLTWLSDLADEIYRMRRNVPMKILNEYYEFFISFARMCKKCSDEQVLIDNVDMIASSLELFVECMELIFLACEKEDYEKKICPLVSVILPSYNHSLYIEKAIESVLRQTYSNIEILIADDASTDDTVDKIMKYKEGIDEIHVFEKNTGANFSFLAQRANGKYIAVMHSDDLWAVDKIEKQVEYMENNTDCGACFTGVEMIDEYGEIVENNIFIQTNMKKERWIRFFYEIGNCLAHPSVMMHKEDYLSRYEGMPGAMWQLPDYWSWICLLLRKEIYVLEEKLTFFRMHESGNNQNVSARNRVNSVRTLIEDTYIWYDIIRNMDNEYFCKAFGDLFERNDPTNDIEIMCEKMFVLLNSETYYRKQAGIFYMFDITRKPEVVEYLKSVYNWGIEDAKQITGNFL